MKHVEEAIVAAMVPSVFAAGQFTAVVLKDGVNFPAARYVLVGHENVNTICGASRLDNFRFRIDIFGKDYVEVLNLTDQVLDNMADLQYPALLVGQIDLYEDQQKLYHRALDFSIWARRPS